MSAISQGRTGRTPAALGQSNEREHNGPFRRPASGSHPKGDQQASLSRRRPKRSGNLRALPGRPRDASMRPRAGDSAGTFPIASVLRSGDIGLPGISRSKPEAHFCGGLFGAREACPASFVRSRPIGVHEQRRFDCFLLSCLSAARSRRPGPSPWLTSPAFPPASRCSRTP